MAIKVEGILKPFGKPIARAVIVVTTLGKSLSLKNTYIRKLTESDGWYSFNLEKGIYLIEYKQNNVLTEVGKVYVTDETPQVITLEELVRTQPAIEVPEDTSDNIDWESRVNTHNSLASFDKDSNQAVKGDSSSVDYEEASLSSVGNRGRRVDEVKSKNGEIGKSSTSFSSQGDILIEDAAYITTPNLDKVDSISVSDTQELVVVTKSSITTPLVSYSSLDVLKDSGSNISRTAEKTQNLTGYSLDSVTTFNYADNKLVSETKEKAKVVNLDLIKVTENYSESLVSSYFEEDGTNSEYPKKDKVISTKFAYSDEPDNTTTLVEDKEGSVIKINPNGGVEVRKENTVFALGSTYISRLIHTGFRSLKEYIVDTFRVGDTLEVDNREKVVKINGKLEIKNRDDFVGDTIFQVFQYSHDGLSNWEDEFDYSLVWRRHNMSINGFVNPLTWSKPYLLVAEDGHEGDTLYVEYQYSADQLSWSDTLRNGDIWRRERTILNGLPTSDWSTPSRIRGFDGSDGDTIYIEYQYSIDGLYLWHSNFSTGDHYRRERFVVNGIAKEWSIPAKVVPEKNEDYFDGYNNTVVQLYIRSKTVPVVPSVDSVYNFETSELTGYNNGWSARVPEGVAPIYIIAASASSVEITDIITPDDWSDPVLLAQSGDTIYPEYQYSPDGINNWHSDFLPTDYFRRERTVVVTPTGVNVGSWSSGVRIKQDGYTPQKGVDYFDGTDGSFVSYIYRLGGSAPAKPTGGTFNGVTETFPVGWRDNPVYSSSQKTWVAKTRYRKIGAGWVSDGWSNPVQWLGTDGADGVNTAQINLYRRSRVIPTPVTSTSRYNFMTGVLTGHNNMWTRTIPVGVDPIWIISAMAVSLLRTDIIEAGDWSDPVVLSQNGEDGIDGEDGLHGNGSYIVRLSSPNQARTNDVQLDNDIKVLAKREPQAGDMLTYELVNPTAADTTFPRRYIRGTKTVSSMGFNAWEGFAFIVNGNAFIDGTLAASALKAKDITGDYISASARIIVGSGNQQSGINGLDTDQWTGWRFWSGNSNPNIAPFRVDRTGKAWLDTVSVKGHIEATSGKFTGELAATSGKINNVVIEKNCTIKGHLAGATGTFSGTVRADKIEGTRDAIRSGTHTVTGVGEFYIDTGVPAKSWGDNTRTLLGEVATSGSISSNDHSRVYWYAEVVSIHIRTRWNGNATVVLRCRLGVDRGWLTRPSFNIHWRLYEVI